MSATRKPAPWEVGGTAMKKRTQVFKRLIRNPMPIMTVAAGALPGAAPPIWAKPQMHTFTCKAFNVSDIVVTIGPLDRKKFQAGDVVKITVQRMRRKRQIKVARTSQPKEKHREHEPSHKQN